MDSTRIAGIVMECNPFHEGHQYILDKAREITGACAVIVIMSGDFVQRGIPAVYAKEMRTRTLLASGADLVLELPVRYALSSAEGFAAGAVSILERLGIVTDLVFGSESGDLAQLLSAAEFLRREPEDYRQLLRTYQAAGLSFPAARERAAAECSSHAILADTANDILGTEYLKALLPSLPLCPHAVPRIRTLSATEHRQLLETSQDPSCLFADDFSDLLLGRLLGIARLPQPHPARPRHPFAEFDGISDDLSDRIERLLPEFVSWTQFCRLLKTRNITYSALSRAMAHILLDIRKVPAPAGPGIPESAASPRSAACNASSYVRVLGCRKDAAALLGSIRRNSAELSLITNLPAPEASCSGLMQDLYASELYDHAARRKYNSKTQPADLSAGWVSEYAKPFLMLPSS